MAEKHKCPVCGKYEFEERDSLDYCDICGWCDDAIQLRQPDYRGGANKLSLNEARKAWAEGRPIE